MTTFKFFLSDSYGAEYTVYHNRQEHRLHHVGAPRMRQESHAKMMGHAAYFVGDITPADAIYLAQWRAAKHAQDVEEITRKYGADVAAPFAAEPADQVKSVWWILPSVGWQHAEL